jgi:hypothetical protein
MKRSLVVLIGFGVMLAPLMPAHATEPPSVVHTGRATIDLGDMDLLTGAPICDFPVSGIVHIMSAHTIVFNGQGVAYPQAIGGAASFTLTNMDTDKTITVNTSGPGYLNGDGLPVIGSGPWLIYEPADQGGLGYYRGRLRLEPASYGVHAVPLTGTAVDLCDRLA